MYYKNEWKMILLTGAGKEEQEEQIVEGELVQEGNDILFKSRELNIVYDKNIWHKLNEVSNEWNKFIYLYVEKDNYRQFH